MDEGCSLDDMWKEIENYGIKRKVLDPRNSLSYDQVRALYLVIRQKRIVDEQIKLIEDLKNDTSTMKNLM